MTRKIFAGVNVQSIFILKFQFILFEIFTSTTLQLDKCIDRKQIERMSNKRYGPSSSHGKYIEVNEQSQPIMFVWSEHQPTDPNGNDNDVDGTNSHSSWFDEGDIIVRRTLFTFGIPILFLIAVLVIEFTRNRY